MRMASQGFTPLTQHQATLMPVMAKVHPMDRSIPPVIMENIIPTARIPFRTICCNTVSRFLQVIKRGFIIVKTAAIARVAITTTNSRLYFDNTLFTSISSYR